MSIAHQHSLSLDPVILLFPIILFLVSGLLSFVILGFSDPIFLPVLSDTLARNTQDALYSVSNFHYTRGKRSNKFTATSFDLRKLRLQTYFGESI